MGSPRAVMRPPGRSAVPEPRSRRVGAPRRDVGGPPKVRRREKKGHNITQSVRLYATEGESDRLGTSRKVQRNKHRRMVQTKCTHAYMPDK